MLELSELELINDCLDGSLKGYVVDVLSTTNVVKCNNIKDAKLVSNILYVLNYNSVIHNPNDEIIEVIFN